MTARILFIEDSAEDAVRAAHEIRRAGIELEYQVANTRQGVVEALDAGPWSAIVSAHDLDGWTGVDALHLVRARDLDIPFILLSGASTEGSAVAAMRDGANDYVLEENLARLGPAVLRELREAASRRERNALYSDEHANRVADLGRLAATVAHEFNNVLMGISPFIEIIRRTTSPERVAAALEQMQRAVQRGKRVTSDILRFTQPAEPVRAPVDVAMMLAAVADEARSLLGSGCVVEVHVERGSDGGRLLIDGDVNQIRQVLSNLVLNARAAMPQTGRLTINAQPEGSSAVHLSITDTGSGIAPETLPHVFEPLFTTKRNGTGLGLSVVHQIVTRHDGEVFVESTPGEGATFHLILPAASRTSPASERGERLRPPKAHVLLVEDDASVSLGIAALLELENMTVETVATGAAALAAVAARRPDVVVLDIGLPDMDGRAVYDGIAALYPGQPVIFSTGHGDRTRFEDLLNHPFARFLLKPYESSHLLDAIHELAAC